MNNKTQNVSNGPQQNSNQILTRPIQRYTTTDGGVFIGKIVGAWRKSLKTRYTATGFDDGVNIKVVVTDMDGVEVELFKQIFISGSPTSPFVKTLNDVGITLEPGESINLNSFRGIPVEITVENVTIDGKTYSNIKSIKKIGPQQVSVTQSTEEKLKNETQFATIGEGNRIRTDEILGLNLD